MESQNSSPTPPANRSDTKKLKRKNQRPTDMDLSDTTPDANEDSEPISGDDSVFYSPLVEAEDVPKESSFFGTHASSFESLDKEPLDCHASERANALVDQVSRAQLKRILRSIDFQLFKSDLTLGALMIQIEEQRDHLRSVMHKVEQVRGILGFIALGDQEDISY